MDIGVSELPGEPPEQSLVDSLVGWLCVLDFAFWWLVMPVAGICSFLAGFRAVS